MAAATLALIEATETPGRSRIRQAVAQLARGWQEEFWRRWRWPEHSLLGPLLVHTFEADLAVEREREHWRRAAGQPERRQRMVRREWRKRVARLQSLDDAAKQRLAADLRGRAMMEADEGTASLEVLVRAVDLPENLDGQFREAFREAFTDAMKQGSRRAAAQLGFSADWLLKDPDAVAQMESYAGYYGDRITKLVPMEWQVQIKKAVIRGLDQGMSAAEMGHDLQGVWGDLRGWQAERIARTESVRARVEGRRSTYAAAGVQMLEWIVKDPCPLCAPRAGKLYPVGSPDLAPLHPDCECDCVASEDDLDRMRAQALAGTGPITPLPREPEPRYAQGGA